MKSLKIYDPDPENSFTKAEVALSSKVVEAQAGKNIQK